MESEGMVREGVERMGKDVIEWKGIGWERDRTGMSRPYPAARRHPRCCRLRTTACRGR